MINDMTDAIDCDEHIRKHKVDWLSDQYRSARMLFWSYLLIFGMFGATCFHAYNYLALSQSWPLPLFGASLLWLGWRVAKHTRRIRRQLKEARKAIS